MGGKPKGSAGRQKHKKPVIYEDVVDVDGTEALRPTLTEDDSRPLALVGSNTGKPGRPRSTKKGLLEEIRRNCPTGAIMDTFVSGLLEGKLYKYERKETARGNVYYERTDDYDELDAAGRIMLGKDLRKALMPDLKAVEIKMERGSESLSLEEQVEAQKTVLRMREEKRLAEESNIIEISGAFEEDDDE